MTSESAEICVRFILIALCITILHKISRRWEQQDNFYAHDSISAHTQRLKREIQERYTTAYNLQLGGADVNAKTDDGKDCRNEDGKSRTEHSNCEKTNACVDDCASGRTINKGKTKHIQDEVDMKQNQLIEGAGDPGRMRRGLKPRINDLKIDTEKKGDERMEREQSDPENTPVQRKRPLEQLPSLTPHSEHELERWERIQLQSTIPSDSIL
ncbi:hypothetical protein VKT23_003616 [Stygiomarasmius scandens]|uniref:Uncharacterized protein n=1 Tax=Marasmiellus scandens TaxID=2682957 RepID=A0ABR1JYH2_9AGAR